MKNQIKILFLGDIVGRPGRQAVARFLNNFKENYDFIIANVENASHGFGLTEKNYKELLEMGIGAMTSGNHIWDRKEIFNFIDDADKLLRPLNYPENIQGQGSRVFKISDDVSIGVINILGTVFMSPITPPWEMLAREIDKIKEITPIIILDIHAEATAEKASCGYISDNLGISAVLGTHTHIQTADEKILENGTAYLTDAGFCGAEKSVIGMDIDDSVKRLKTSLPVKFDVAAVSQVQVNGVELVIDTQTGKAANIKRIFELINLEEGN